MRLTRKKAIQITIELWEFLAETGERFKGAWPKWEEYGKMMSGCPLCEYDDRQFGLACNHCPLTLKFFSCFDAGFRDWSNAGSNAARRVHAREFLEQLKQL